jgi:hypothetical protein
MLRFERARQVRLALLAEVDRTLGAADETRFDQRLRCAILLQTHFAVEPGHGSLENFGDVHTQLLHQIAGLPLRHVIEAR